MTKHNFYDLNNIEMAKHKNVLKKNHQLAQRTKTSFFVIVTLVSLVGIAVVGITRSSFFSPSQLPKAQVEGASTQAIFMQPAVSDILSAGNQGLQSPPPPMDACGWQLDPKAIKNVHNSYATLDIQVFKMMGANCNIHAWYAFVYLNEAPHLSNPTGFWVDERAGTLLNVFNSTPSSNTTKTWHAYTITSNTYLSTVKSAYWEAFLKGAQNQSYATVSVTSSY